MSYPASANEEHTRTDDSIDFLVIGHVTRDLFDNDPDSSQYAVGGTVSFAAVTARRLGYQPVVLTRAADNVDLSVIQEHAEVIVLPSPSTTTFANIYTPTGRVQYCYTPARAITARDVEPRLQQSHIVLLGPLVGEIPAEVAAIFPEETLVAAVPQGWMRRWDASGLVRPIPWESAEQILPHVDVLILSIEDVGGDLREIDRFLSLVPLVIMTQYKEGSTVYHRSGDMVDVVRVPPRPAKEVDPTGAGDIFATAFLLRMRDTGDPIDAARYANIAASFGVEAIGVEGIPVHQQVIEYMIQNPWSAKSS